jgi:hypothetical protein
MRVHQIAQETDARFGHGGRMCKRLLSTVAPLTARSKLNERGADSSSRDSTVDEHKSQLAKYRHIAHPMKEDERKRLIVNFPGIGFNAFPFMTHSFGTQCIGPTMISSVAKRTATATKVIKRISDNDDTACDRVRASPGGTQGLGSRAVNWRPMTKINSSPARLLKN